jgi:hypothetical protein
MESFSTVLLPNTNRTLAIAMWDFSEMTRRWANGSSRPHAWRLWR